MHLHLERVALCAARSFFVLGSDETLSFDEDGDPESQRLRVVNHVTSEELASYDGSTLSRINVVPYFGGVSLLSFCDGWNNGDWDAHEEWFLRDDHGGTRS